jgi:hypothetical protein
MNDDVLWRLTRLGENLFTAGAAEDVVSTSEVVFEKLILPTDNPSTVMRGQITTLLSLLITITKKSTETLQERVDILFVKWLRHPMSFGSDLKPYSNNQRSSYLKRLEILLEAGILNIEKDFESLKRFLRWFNVWDVKWKQRAMPILHGLKKRYPAPGLWDIVQ